MEPNSSNDNNGAAMDEDEEKFWFVSIRNWNGSSSLRPQPPASAAGSPDRTSSHQASQDSPTVMSACMQVKSARFPEMVLPFSTPPNMLDVTKMLSALHLHLQYPSLNGLLPINLNYTTAIFHFLQWVFQI